MVSYGRIRLDTLLWFQIGLLILIPLYTYYVAVYKDDIDPFPHTTVTNTACPYPQNIVFRFGMLTAASFLALIFFCIFRWFKYIQQKIQYPHSAFPRIIYLAAQLIILPYAITIGTIDSAGTKDIHDICAVIFFIGLFGLILYLTVVLGKMRNWDASIVKSRSWFLKKATCYWNVLVALYCLVIIVMDSSKGDDMVVVIEWNLVLVNLVWVLSFQQEWKKVYLTFNGKEDAMEIGERNRDIQEY